MELYRRKFNNINSCNNQNNSISKLTEAEKLEILDANYEYSINNVEIQSKRCGEFFKKISFKSQNKKNIKYGYRKIINLHLLCCETARKTKKYIIDNNMVETLISYIGQEVEAAENHPDTHYKTKVKERLTRLLWTIYSSYFYSINGSINKSAIYTLILRLLQESCFSDTSFFIELTRYMEHIFKHRDDSLNLSYFSENIEKVVVISLDCDDSTNLEDPNELVWDRFKELRHELSLQRKTIVPIEDEEISFPQCNEEISKVEDPDFVQISGNSETSCHFRNIAKYYDHIEMSCGDWKFSASNFKKPIPEMKQLNYWEMKQDPYNNNNPHQMLQSTPNNWIWPMNSASSCYSPQIYMNPNFVPLNSHGSIGSMSPNYYPAAPHQVHQYQHHQLPFRSPSSNIDCQSYNNNYQYMNNSPIYHSSPISSPTLLQQGGKNLLFRPKSAPLPSSSASIQSVLQRTQYRNITPSESGSNFVSSSNISTNSMVVDSTVDEFQSQIVSCSNTHQFATTKDTFNHKEIQVSMDKENIERRNSLQNKIVEYNESSTSREYLITNSVKTQNCESSSEDATKTYATLPQNEINSNSNEIKSTTIASRTEECNLNNAKDDLFPPQIAEISEKHAVESIQNENELENSSTQPLDSAINNVITESFDQIKVVAEINTESSQTQKVVNIITSKVEDNNQLIESTKEDDLFLNCASTPLQETIINNVSNINKECDSLIANNNSALELAEFRELKETICELPNDLYISTVEEVNPLQIAVTDDSNKKLDEIVKSSVNDQIDDENKREENIVETETNFIHNSAIEKSSEVFIEKDQSLTYNNVVIENIESKNKELSAPTGEEALFEEVASTELSINQQDDNLESNEALKVAENSISTNNEEIQCVLLNVIIENNSNSTIMPENQIVCSDSIQAFKENEVILPMEQSPEDIKISVNAYDNEDNSEFLKELTKVCGEEKEADFQITVATKITEESIEKDAVTQLLDNKAECAHSVIIANNNVEDKNIIQPMEEQNIDIKDSVIEESDSLKVFQVSVDSNNKEENCDFTKDSSNVDAAEEKDSQIVADAYATEIEKPYEEQIEPFSCTLDNSHNITDSVLTVITNNKMENNTIIKPLKNQNIETENFEEARIDEFSISQESDSLSINRDLKAGQSLKNENNALIAENNNQMEEIVNEAKGKNKDISINNNSEAKIIEDVLSVELEEKGKKLKEIVKPIEEINIEISSRELKANIEFENNETTTAIIEDPNIKELTETLQEILADNSVILRKEERNSVEDNPSMLYPVNISKDNVILDRINNSTKKMDIKQSVPKIVTEEVLLEENAEESCDEIDIEELLLGEADDPLKINASDQQQQHNNTEILENNSTISENGLKTLQGNGLPINEAETNSIEVSLNTHGLQLLSNAIDLSSSKDNVHNSKSDLNIDISTENASFVEKDPLNLSDTNKRSLNSPNNNTTGSVPKTKAELKIFPQFEDISDDEDDDNDDVPLVDRYKNQKIPNLNLPKSPVLKNFENHKEKSSTKKLGNQDKEPKNQKKDIQSLNLNEQKNCTIRRPRGRPKKIMLKSAETEQITLPSLPPPPPPPVSAIVATSPTKKHKVFLQKYENENKSNNNLLNAEVSSKKPREKSTKEKLKKDNRKVQFQEVAIIGETTIQKVATVNFVKAAETVEKNVKYNSAVLKTPIKVTEKALKDYSTNPATEFNTNLNNTVDKDDFQHITAENSEKLPISDNGNSFSKTDKVLELNGISNNNSKKSKPCSDAVQSKKESKSKELLDSKKSDNLKNKLEENVKKGKVEVKKKDECGTKKTQQSKKDKDKSSQQLNNNDKVIIIKSDNNSREKNEKTSKNRSSKVSKEVVPSLTSSDRKESKKIIEAKEDINLKSTEKTTKNQKTIKDEEKSSRSDGSNEKTSRKAKNSNDTGKIGKIITSKEVQRHEDTKKCSNTEKLKIAKSDKSNSKNKSAVDEKNKGIREEVEEKVKNEQLFDTSKEKKTVKKEKLLNNDDTVNETPSKAITLKCSASKKKSDKKEKKSTSIIKCEKLLSVELVENLNKETIISSAPADVASNDGNTIKVIKEEKNLKRPVEKSSDVTTKKEIKAEQLMDKSKCSLKSQKSHSLEETVEKLRKRKVSLKIFEADNELVKAVKEDEKKDTVMAKEEDVKLAIVKTNLTILPSTEIANNKCLEDSISSTNEEVSPILEQPNNKVNFINEEKVSNLVPPTNGKRNSISLSSNPIIEQKVKKIKLMVHDEETQVNDDAITKDDHDNIIVKTEAQKPEEHPFPFNFSATINNCSTPQKVEKTAKSFESRKRKEYPSDYEEFVRKAPKTESSPTIINTTTSFDDTASSKVPSLLEKNNVATFCSATTQYSDGYLLNPNGDGAIESSSAIVDGTEGGYSSRNNDTGNVPTIGNVFAETTVHIGTFLDSTETDSNADEHSYAINKLQTEERDIINQSSPISSATANNDSQNNQMDVWIGQNECLPSSSADNNHTMNDNEIEYMFNSTDIENLSFSSGFPPLSVTDIMNEGGMSNFDEYFPENLMLGEENIPTSVYPSTSDLFDNNKDSSGCISSDNNQQQSTQHLQKSPQKFPHNISVDSTNKNNKRVYKQISIMEPFSTKQKSPIKETKIKTPIKETINKRILIKETKKIPPIPPQTLSIELPKRTSVKKKLNPPPRKNNDLLKKTPTATTNIEINKKQEGNHHHYNSHQIAPISLINNKEHRILPPEIPPHTISNDLFDEVRKSEICNQYFNVNPPINKSMPQLAPQSSKKNESESEMKSSRKVSFENGNGRASDTAWIAAFEKNKSAR